MSMKSVSLPSEEVERVLAVDLQMTEAFVRALMMTVDLDEVLMMIAVPGVAMMMIVAPGETMIVAPDAV